MLKTSHNPNEFPRILACLRAGVAPGKLAREIRSRHPEEPGLGPRLVDLASACLWLADGVPSADILTMLECRHRFDLSPAQCRTHAVEILWAVQHEIDAIEGRSILPPKEHDYAAA